jgi:hypothetical protein
MKIVIVIDQELGPGLAANAAAALALSLSGRVGEVNGPDLRDGSGSLHPGILKLPIPVLKAPRARLAELRARALESPGIAALDFPDIAQAARSYGEYEEALGRAGADEIAYRGICLYGEETAVARLTGSLPLYR